MGGVESVMEEHDRLPFKCPGCTHELTASGAQAACRLSPCGHRVCHLCGQRTRTCLECGHFVAKALPDEEARLLIERHEAKRGEGENEEGRHGSSDSDEDSDDDEDDDEYECGPGRWPPPRRAKKAARRSKSTSGGGGGGGPSGSAARGPAVEIAPGHLRLSSNVRLGGGGGTQVWLGRLCVPQAPPVAVMVRGVRLVGQASSNPRSRPHLANLKAKLLLTLDAARGCRQLLQYLGVSVPTSGPGNEHLCVVAEHLDGCSLAFLMQEGGPLPARQCVAVARQVMMGLRHLHQQAGVVHRAVQPDSVLVPARGGQGGAMLCDYGVRHHAAQVAAGLVAPAFLQSGFHYMAPEVLLEHRGVEAPADVWSVGALALHALTGRPPWHGLTHAQVLQQVRAGQVPELPPESLPPALHALLLKCLSFAPADRPTDDEVLQELTRLKKHGVDAPPPTATPARTPTAAAPPSGSAADKSPPTPTTPAASCPPRTMPASASPAAAGPSSSGSGASPAAGASHPPRAPIFTPSAGAAASVHPGAPSTPPLSDTAPRGSGAARSSYAPEENSPTAGAGSFTALSGGGGQGAAPQRAGKGRGKGQGGGRRGGGAKQRV